MKQKQYIVLEFNLRKNVVCTFDVKKDIYKTSLSQFVQISLTDFHFGNQSSSYLQEQHLEISRHFNFLSEKYPARREVLFFPTREAT